LILLQENALPLADKDLEQLDFLIPQSNLVYRISREMLRKTSCDVNELHQYVLANELSLEIVQKAAYKVMFDRINRKASEIIFLDASSETVKTFAFTVLLAESR
jgi:hypothetical protein